MRNHLVATSPRVTSLDLIPAIASPLHLPRAPREIHAVAVVDDSGPAAPPASVLLAIGMDAAAIPELLDEAARTDAAAVMVGGETDLDEESRSVASRNGTAILRLAEGVTWQRAATDIAGLLDGTRRPATGLDTLDAVPDGDLFALAEAVCALVDAPVTIEDRNTHVLAFSARQDEADFVRVASILQRMRPRDYVETAMDTVLGASGPVYLPAGTATDGQAVMPRVAIAVRDGERLLGTIWAVVREPLDPGRERLVTIAADAARHHMILAGRHQEDSRLADRLTAMLDSRPDAAAAAEILGVTGPALVVCVVIPDAEPSPPPGELSDYLTRLARRDRVGSALAMHLEGAGIPGAAANLRLGVYAVVSLLRHSEHDIVRACEDFASLLGGRAPLFVGIGRAVPSAEHLRRSRDDAEAAARALAHGDGFRRVALVSEVMVDTVLLELAERVESGRRGPSGAYARLLEYDADRGAHLVETIMAWLDAFGDVIAASAACGVHPNTFRYRLMRAGEVAEIDLDDPDERFAVAFQHRLFGPSPSRPESGQRAQIVTRRRHPEDAPTPPVA